MAPRDLLHYRIVDELGHGAMGQVVRAVDQRLGRQVALKLLPPDVAGDPGWEARQLREARAVSQLNHPGIVTLYDIASANGQTFLVMELVQGERLAELARRGLPWRRAVELVAQIADALAAAHALGILHRDIKTDNVMVTTAGQPKVLDFGLAKLRDAVIGPAAAARRSVVMAAASTDATVPAPLPAPAGAPGASGDDDTLRAPGGLAALPRAASPALDATLRSPPRAATSDSGATLAGQLIGTPAYMAPECYAGVADVRSEVFALGVVLYEALTGQRPFEAADPLALMRVIQEQVPVAPSRVAPARKIPAAVDAVVLRALAKAPADRFADMPALAAALRAALRDTRRRRRALAAGASAIGAAAVIGGVALALGGGTSRVVTPAPAAGSAAAPPLAIEVRSSRRLTLDPGCEDAPSFFPDGKTLVYDGLVDGDYDLFTLDLASNARRRLTSEPGWEMGAAPSPDGRYLAYLRAVADGRALRVVALDGSRPPLDVPAVSGYPWWIDATGVGIGHMSGAVVRLDIVTGETRELVALPVGSVLSQGGQVGTRGLVLSWYTSEDRDLLGVGELPPGGPLRIVTDGETWFRGGLRPARSGTGYYGLRRGAGAGNELIYWPWGGGEPTVVPGGVSPGARIDVSPAGDRLVFTTCREHERVTRMRPDGGFEPIAGGAWDDRVPHNIDGRHLVVTSDRLGDFQAWIIDLRGEAPPRSVSPRGTRAADVARDLDAVAYTLDRGRSGIWVAALDGTGERALTSDPTDSWPRFTGDGRHVIFERVVDGALRLLIVPRTGGEPRVLADGVWAGPSPIDDTVLFLTRASDVGGSQLMRTDTQGRAPVEVPGVPPGVWDSPTISQDGKRVAMVRGGGEVWIIDLTGAAPARRVWTNWSIAVTSLAWGAGPDEVIIALSSYDGDLWLAEGRFP